MNYSELAAHVQEVAEDSLTTTQINQFIKNAEQLIYHSVEFPDMWKHCTADTTPSNKYLQAPNDYIWLKYLAIQNGSDVFSRLQQKQPDWLMAAYPDDTATGLPKYYSMFTDTYFVLAPVPDAAYTVQIGYMYQPESIVTASTTWLGDNFDTVLLNGTLMEVARFQKTEEDIFRMYESMYQQSLMLLKNSLDGKQDTETARTNEPRRVPV